MKGNYLKRSMKRWNIVAILKMIYSAHVKKNESVTGTKFLNAHTNKNMPRHKIYISFKHRSLIRSYLMHAKRVKKEKI